MFKNRLQEYAQKTSLPFPVYTTVNEGQDHLPEFKCSVTVNDARYDSPAGFKYKKEAKNATGYDSPPGFRYKKEAENAAAQVAVEDLHKLGLDIRWISTLKLQEYAQKTSLPLPVYTTVNEGQEHLPEFKCSVTVNGARYDSPPGFKYKKEAENAAAQVAVEDLHKLGLDIHFKETRLLKNLLSELAVKKNIPLPTYQFTKEGIAHCPTFTATVEINGESYTGAPGNNKKEAARNAAYEAIRSIRTQDCNSFPQIELHDETKQNNDSKQEFKVTNAVSKLPTDNSTSNNQLLVGTGSHSAENAEKLNVKDVPTVSEKINVENPCEVGGASEKSMVKDSGEVENAKPSINDANPGLAPVEKPQQDPILVKQHGLKEEMTAIIQNKEHGFKQLEGMQQGSEEVVLTESIVKRIRSEHEDAEHMCKRKKKLRKRTRPK